MSYPAISLATASAYRHRHSQKRLQTARQPPIHPNSSPDHRFCNFLTPLPLSSRCLSVSTGGFGLKRESARSSTIEPERLPGQTSPYLASEGHTVRRKKRWSRKPPMLASTLPNPGWTWRLAPPATSDMSIRVRHRVVDGPTAIPESGDSAVGGHRRHEGAAGSSTGRGIIARCRGQPPPGQRLCQGYWQAGQDGRVGCPRLAQFAEAVRPALRPLVVTGGA